MREWETSAWAFDRIVYYSTVACDAVGPDDLGEKLLKTIRREIKILRTYQEGFGSVSLDPRPLYFALSALEQAVEDGCTIDVFRTEKILESVNKFAKEPVKTAKDEKLRAMLITQIKRVQKNIQERPTD